MVRSATELFGLTSRAINFDLGTSSDNSSSRFGFIALCRPEAQSRKVAAGMRETGDEPLPTASPVPKTMGMVVVASLAARAAEEQAITDTFWATRSAAVPVGDRSGVGPSVFDPDVCPSTLAGLAEPLTERGGW